MSLPKPHRLIATCARGTERAVKHELKAAGASELQSVDGAVVARGDADVVATMNMSSRVASRILIGLAELEASTEDALVEQMRALPFEEWIPRGATIAGQAHLKDAAVTHSLHAARRVKDAIVDRLRDKGRPRPEVDPGRPTLRFVLRWEKDRAELALDTTGIPLHRRGYRAAEGEAPMRETLAAAVLALGHADTRRPFHDPCCGTGTLAIEQAWRSMKRAPGLGRRFAVDAWLDDRLELKGPLSSARARADEEKRPRPEAPIRLSDWHPAAIKAAEASVEKAGLRGLVRLEQVDARKVSYDEDPVICANLPFGERLGKSRLQLEGFYRTLGQALVEVPGARILLFTAHPRPEGLLGLGRPVKRWSLYSGQMKAMLRRWDHPEG